MICRTGSGKELSIIMPAEDILLPGKHNILNYMAAFEATRDLVSDAVCREVAASFRGVEHRLERGRVLNGVVYINDAIGTSPSRTIAGLHALNRKPVLIAGGYDKHIPFDALGEEICRYTKKVFLSGETAEKIRNACTANRRPRRAICLPTVSVSAGTNCGRNVRKKRRTFGFSTFIRIPRR